MSEEAGTPAEGAAPEPVETPREIHDGEGSGESPEEETEGRVRRLPRTVYNPISLTGAALAVSMTFST